MSLKRILTFRWLVDLFRRERSKLRAALWPFAVSVVEDLFDRDFNRDGVVADARIELSKLLRQMSEIVKRSIFEEYFDRDGTIRMDLIEVLPVKLLKKVLAIAKLAQSLRDRGWPVPVELVVKHGWGLLDSVLQDAYEKGVKPKPQ